jgi:flagellar FliL protein
VGGASGKRFRQKLTTWQFLPGDSLKWIGNHSLTFNTLVIFKARASARACAEGSMTDENAAAEEDGEEDAAGGGGKKKLILFGAIGLVVLLAVGGGAYYFLFMGESMPAPAPGEEAVPQEVQRPVVFYDLPEMTVNLATEGRTTYLKVRIALEVENRAMIEQIQPYLPRILDAFQIYLRELRPADLEGSAGLFRLKEELLRRINLSVYPAKVEGVLFKEILVQ